MLPYLLPLVPDHKCYCEPFAGGAALFFAKKKAPVEIINDNFDALVNFYRVFQDKAKFKQLQKLCNETLYARSEHDKAIEKFKKGTDVERAWALWVKVNTGFSGRLDGGFSTTKHPASSPCIRFRNYKNNLAQCARRLEETQIEELDAVKCIQIYDSEDTFFYLDPPYMDADQGHYKGYGISDYERLLDTLKNLKGKFLLSCYPDPVIQSFLNGKSWNLSYQIMEQSISARNRKHGSKTKKTEMLVWNYDAPAQMELFQ